MYSCHLLNSFNVPNVLKKECSHLHFTDNKTELLEGQIAVQVLRESHVLSVRPMALNQKFKKILRHVPHPQPFGFISLGLAFGHLYFSTGDYNAQPGLRILALYHVTLSVLLSLAFNTALTQDRG